MIAAADLIDYNFERKEPTAMKIIITVDRGHFRAYRLTKPPLGSEKISLIESYDSLDAHGKLGDKVTDKAGRFAMTGGREGTPKGYGEPHNIELETEKKILKHLVRDIEVLLSRERCGSWYFAAPEDIVKRIVGSLKPELKERMKKAVSADLTKTDKSELMDYFR